MENIEEIKKEYSIKAPLYADFCKELVNQIFFLLKENGIEIGFPIEHRVKSSESIVDKIQRNNLDISSIEEINDFAGIRTICLFYKDLSLVEKLLTDNLIIHKVENTLSRLSDNTFGYGSIHFEVSPKDEWLKIPTFKKHASCKVEIQLRTAAQHIWAAVSHTLQYKKETDIPLELRRTINRSAALLETVDLEFERVQIERKKYLEQIDQTKDNDKLNIDTLKFVLDRNLPLENRDVNEDYSAMLNDLHMFGVEDMESLEALLKKHMKAVLQKNAELIESRKDTMQGKHDLGFFHSGFLRHTLREEFGQEKVAAYLKETYHKK